jgi:glyoxylase-like metal-dependent hydrolase (beta-lactamase superfamily II)/8-oxo-dGTP pyrophosphatase MutT (NUDIX family)
MSTTTPGNPIIPAASVILFRSQTSSELLVVRRTPSLRFFGGFLAFPGGKTSPADVEVPVQPIHPDHPIPKAQSVRIVAAARELFEETGVLLARASDKSFPTAGATLTSWRRELTNQKIAFRQLLSNLQLSIYEADFEHLGSLVTPPFASIRYDTSFFLAHLPAGQEADIWPGELDQGFWSTAKEALNRWRRGECLVSPPSVVILQAIERQPANEAPAQLAALFQFHSRDEIPPILFAPEVRLIPLRTLALPPTSYTNAYLVGREKSYLIDPGCSDADEQARLFRYLDRFLGEGGRLEAVVLTHQHIDHIGAASVCAERYHLPILAHSHTAQALKDKVVVTGTIQDGDRLDLGRAPDNDGEPGEAESPGWHLQAMHTPGHASGHLAFFEPRYRLLFAGDMVSTISSVVIAPPDGNLTIYLESLNRLAALDCRLLLPGHGGVSSSPPETIELCIRHRVEREQQLLAALASGPRILEDLLVEVYKGVPEPLMKFARLQLQAGLEKLQREGRVIMSGGEWEALHLS